MGLEQLRSSHDELANQDFTFDEREELCWEDERVQPGSPDYVPTIYYDPARFKGRDGLDRLEWLVRSRRPAGENLFWHFRALPPEELKRWSPFVSGRLEGLFLARGYLSDVDTLPTQQGTPAQTVQHQEALSAFYHATVVAETVIKAAQSILGHDCPAWLLKEASTILEPMAGRRASAIPHPRKKNGQYRVRDVPLVMQDGLLFGCQNFSEHRTVIATEYHELDRVLAVGRRRLGHRQENADEVFDSFIQNELSGVARKQLPGIVAWACQQVALLRVSAAQAAWRTSPPWFEAQLRGGVATRLGEALNRGFRSWQHIVKETAVRGQKRQRLLTGYRFATDERVLNPRRVDPRDLLRVKVSTVERYWIDNRDKLLTEIAGFYQDFGWERPLIRHLDFSLRNSVEIAFLGGWVNPAEDRWDLPAATLQSIARWLGELRRWGRGFLDAEMAAALLSVVHGGNDEEEEHAFGSADGQSAIAFLDSLMPTELWADILQVLQNMGETYRPVPIIYDWNPVGPVWQPPRGDGSPAPIVTQGAYLAFPQAEVELWCERAARIGPEGLLVI